MSGVPDKSWKPPCVVLETSMGEIVVELYWKHAPNTCRNFAELARRGYYNNVKFHRIIPDFMIQGGDPTGTGKGGASIYGKYFEDEIHPDLKHTGKLGDRDILVFNISGVHPSEYIERADLHMQWKRPLSWRKKRVLRLSILNLNQVSRPQIEIAMLRRSAWGSWHNLDLTDAVITSLEDGNSEQRQHLVGLLAQEEEEEIGKLDISAIFTSSFLVVFSEDDDHLEIGKMRPRTGMFLPTSFRYKEKREIVDNELPNYPQEIGHESRAEVQARIKYRPLDSANQRDTVSQKASTKEQKKTKRRRRKKRRLQLKWRKSWWKTEDRNEGDYSSSAEVESEEEGEKNDSLCQRRNLVVDFGKIGWSEWVIAPKKFDAHFCSGECSSTLAQISQPSNYATLRDILARGSKVHPGTSRFCCVPETLSAVPLLFYDENKNVVLKKFPAMRVESCVCR